MAVASAVTGATDGAGTPQKQTVKLVHYVKKGERSAVVSSPAPPSHRGRPPDHSVIARDWEPRGQREPSLGGVVN